MAGLELVGNDEYRFIARGSGGLGGSIFRRGGSQTAD